MIPADVEKFIARKFRSADRENAVALLEAAALHDGTAPSPRLLRCAAVASDGSIERLRMDQKIEPLNPQDIADLGAKRNGTSNFRSTIIAYLCPACGANVALKIDRSIELPADDYDEYSVAVVRCQACRFRGVTTCGESRRGALDSESVDYRCHQLADADLERLATSVEECPAPPNRNCLCRSHPLLSQTDSKGLGLIAQVLKSFPMKDVP